MTARKLILMETGVDVKEFAKELLDRRHISFQSTGTLFPARVVRVVLARQNGDVDVIMFFEAKLSYFFPHVTSLKEIQQRLSEIFFLHISGFNNRCFMLNGCLGGWRARA